MTDENEREGVLLPCPVPWCAGEAQLLGEDEHYFTQQPDARIKCKKCGLTTEISETYAEAIAAWNTRQPTDARIATQSDIERARNIVHSVNQEHRCHGSDTDFLSGDEDGTLAILAVLEAFRQPPTEAPQISLQKTQINLADRESNLQKTQIATQTDALKIAREALYSIERRCAEFEAINLVGKTTKAKEAGTLRRVLQDARDALAALEKST